MQTAQSTTPAQVASAHLSSAQTPIKPHYDVVVVGGGITGAGIANMAAQAGLSVLLVEQFDFAAGTSSRSSKMVHGGLRYLAMGDIKTTLHSVQERERLLTEAAGLVTPLDFMMAHYKKVFPPPFLFRLVLRMYDWFAGKRYYTRHSATALIGYQSQLRPLNLLSGSGFIDALTDDSRLVMRVLAEAVYHGADIRNYTKVTQILTDAQGQVSGVVLVDLRHAEQVAVNPTTASSHVDTDTKATSMVHCKVVINATGAWVDALRQPVAQVLDEAVPPISAAATNPQALSVKPKPATIRPARGSHLVISPKRLAVDRAYLLSHPTDGRSVFIYPWENRTIIGTTDLDHRIPLAHEVGIEAEEVTYLLTAANHTFPAAKLTPDDIIATWSGVRPLIASGKRNPTKEKRNHSIWVEDGLISVSGGKLTTFRLIALDVLNAAKPWLPNLRLDKDTPVFTSATSDPNAQQAILHTYPYWQALPSADQQRLQGSYGRDILTLCQDSQPEDWQRIADTSVYWVELRHALRHEQVVHLDDLLLRRTRLGLLLAEGGLDATLIPRIKALCQAVLGWDEATWQAEAERYGRLWHRYYYLPDGCLK